MCHIKAFEFFEGVPNQVVCDNLKSAVIKNSRNETLLNHSYRNLSDHYDFIIAPTRSRKPKDKSLAEVSVQIVQRWILAPLRDHQFNSVDELNEQISKRLLFLNQKQTKTFPKSRESFFLEIEKKALHALPYEPYQINEWKYKVKVPNDYHVECDGHYYSVPYHYINQLVDIRISEKIIEVFIQNQRLTTHIRKFERRLSTNKEHQPLEHRHQSNNDVESACEFALKFKKLNFKQFLDILKNKTYLNNQNKKNKLIKEHHNIRGANYYKGEK